jgi:hypothetical protein
MMSNMIKPVDDLDHHSTCMRRQFMDCARTTRNFSRQIKQE